MVHMLCNRFSFSMYSESESEIFLTQCCPNPYQTYRLFMTRNAGVYFDNSGWLGLSSYCVQFDSNVLSLVYAN